MTTISPRPRLAPIDVMRGTAIIAMIGYHLLWDLSYLGFLGFDLTAEVGWVVVQRCILGSFLILVGIGLQLGHGRGIVWRGFLRRWIMLLLAAGAMSLGTFFAFGDAFAFFGILHAIALFSLLGLGFVRLPWWLTAVAAVAVVVLGVAIHSDAFNTRWLAWVGFWTDPPRTADLVSLFPWFGAVLAGIALGKVLPWREWTWAPGDPLTRGLRLLGRWSLVVYLVHQPIMLGVLYPLAMWLRPGVVAEEVEPLDAATFLGQCRPACEANGGPAPYCTAYCGCALEQIEAGGLWAAVNTEPAGPAVNSVVTLCRAMAEKP